MAAVPAPIQRFLDTTNAGDTAGFLDCFTVDATLVDWGRRFSGREGISRWNQSDNIGVKAKLRLIRIEGAAGVYHVTVAVTGGGFNGEGTMAFTLSGDRIAQLVIS
ncbi:MAG TPA: nuclear transport factor 2 family protein [Devosia sp.]|nr:nuclear transport factor 2 family protein [Devosia sp.]